MQRKPIKVENEKKPTLTGGATDAQLTELVSFINTTMKKESGEERLMAGNNAADAEVPYWVKTGIPQLDYAVGGAVHPGFPGARFIEIYGENGSGKSTLSVWIMKQAIEQIGALAMYQDSEQVLTPEILDGTAIDVSRIAIDRPITLEEVFDMQEKVLTKVSESYPDRPLVLVTDSIAACSTKSEMEGDMEAAGMGIHARMMSKGLRKIKGYIANGKVLSLWTNQVRKKIGQAFGDSDVTFGGNAMSFYASVRLKLKRIKTLKDTGTNQPTGCTIEVSVTKNKVAAPNKTVQYNIDFIEDESGSYPLIDVDGAIIDWLKDHGKMGDTSGYYEVDGKKHRKGDVKKLMQTDKAFRDRLVEEAYSIK